MAEAAHHSTLHFPCGNRSVEASGYDVSLVISAFIIFVVVSCCMVRFIFELVLLYSIFSNEVVE